MVISFYLISFKMKTIILLTLCILTVLVPTEAQFNLPFDSDCTAGRLIDPFLVQALKTKYPKKFGAKLDYGKDLGLDSTKYRLGAARLLAKQMKNLNALNYDIQNMMLQQQQQQQQQAMMQQLIPDPTAALAQQQQQQQQLNTIQIPIDTARSILGPQLDQQVAALSQMTDPRYQQPTFQLTGAQSTPCTTPDCPCNCESEDVQSVLPIPGPLSAVVSTCLGVLKNIFK